MVQVIQIKRKFTGAGVPANLAPGELAYNSTGDKLYVGGDLNTIKGLVGSERQLEIHAASPAQTVAGAAKTFPLNLLKVPGGNVGEFLSMSAADGSLAYAPMVSASQQFVGSFAGDTGVVTFTAASGGTGPGLPAAATGNNGWYVIANVAGATPPAGSGVTGPFEVGDWIISNGTLWTHLAFGGISSVTAADVGVVAPVTGGDDVQEVLESLEQADIDQAALIAANAAAILALEGDDAAQDALIANKITKPATVAAIGNIATYADLTGGVALDGGVSIADIYAEIDLKQDITSAGDVKGPAAAIDSNIAVYDTTTGKLIKDGGQTIAQIMATAGDVKGQTAAIAAADNIAVYNAVDPKSIKDGGVAIAALATSAQLATYLPLAGGTVTGPIHLPITAPVVDTESANKKYVDDQINSIPGATPPEVTAPELTGDGTTLTPITFTGITAEAVTFGGKGLSTNVLTLLVVDGGEYV